VEKANKKKKKKLTGEENHGQLKPRKQKREKDLVPNIRHARDLSIITPRTHMTVTSKSPHLSHIGLESSEENMRSVGIYCTISPRLPRRQCNLKRLTNWHTELYLITDLKIPAPKPSMLLSHATNAIEKHYKHMMIKQSKQLKQKRAYISKSLVGVHQCPELKTRISESTHSPLTSSN
ncbi:nuclear poly(a) polymerase, partial [Striga asiatica]